jgi:DNA-binding XRE family transcriptional regulator
MTETEEKIRQALDYMRDSLGYTSDYQLADHLGVSQKTISFWRNGRLTKGDRVLATLLTEHSEQAQVGCARKVN